MTTLEKIFYKCNEFKIYPCLDNSYCYTDTKIKIPKNYIGCIYSITNIDEILESISEEGSSTINYKIKSTKFTEKIINIFSTILIEHGYDPYIEDDIVSIVISYEDLFGNIKDEEYLEEDEIDDDYDDEDDEVENVEDETDDKEDVEDDKEDDKEDVDDVDNVEDVDDDKEDVDDDKEDVEDVDDDKEDVDNVEDVDDDKEDVEDDKEDVHDVEDVVEDVEDVENKVDEVNVVEDEEEYTHEKLKKKYRAELVELAQNLGISVWKGKNIHKHLKSDIIDCIIFFKKNDF
jgi:hypothetical protein